MATSSATLAGNRVTSARTYHPAWGCWHGEVSIDGEVALSGSVEMVIADLTLRGTVLSGGAAKGRSHFRLVGGAGGWGRTLPRRSYANDAQVKVATVLGDAATAAGETIEASSLPSSAKVGPAWVRPEGPAARLLELLAPAAWYVGEDGITRLGKRSGGVLPAGVTHGEVDRARGTVTLAAESIATILPGLVVDGLTAVDVLHEVTPKGLRSTIWGAMAGATSRHLAAWRALLEQLDPDRLFRGVTEYRVVTQEGERLNLQPVRASTGMPSLARVVVRPGVSGARSTVAIGSRVLVGFVDSDAARPVVLGFEDAAGEGFTPIMTHIDAAIVRLGEGVLPGVRAGDLAGGMFACAPTQTKVLV